MIRLWEDLVFLVTGSTDQLFQHNYVECTLALKKKNLPKCPLNFYYNRRIGLLFLCSYYCFIQCNFTPKLAAKQKGHKQIGTKEEKKEYEKCKSPRGETVVAGDFYWLPPFNRTWLEHARGPTDKFTERGWGRERNGKINYSGKIWRWATCGFKSKREFATHSTNLSLRFLPFSPFLLATFSLLFFHVFKTRTIHVFFLFYLFYLIMNNYGSLKWLTCFVNF